MNQIYEILPETAGHVSWLSVVNEIKQVSIRVDRIHRGVAYLSLENGNDLIYFLYRIPQDTTIVAIEIPNDNINIMSKCHLCGMEQNVLNTFGGGNHSCCGLTINTQREIHNDRHFLIVLLEWEP